MAGRSGSIKKKALAIGDRVAAETGVFVVDVSYENDVLCYYIDTEGGVDIDTCEKFSRAVEEALDAEDPIEGAYSLDVSSPGVDRKLKTEREFNYYIGREVEVKLYAPSDGRKEFDGLLKSFADGTAVTETGDGDIEVPLSSAAYIRLKFTF